MIINILRILVFYELLGLLTLVILKIKSKDIDDSINRHISEYDFIQSLVFIIGAGFITPICMLLGIISGIIKCLKNHFL